MKLIQVEYHRNGVCGEPFHAVLFEDEGKKMLATVFDEPGYVAVIDVELACTPVGVTFGSNSFRGDFYEKKLREWIEDYRKQAPARFKATLNAMKKPLGERE